LSLFFLQKGKCERACEAAVAFLHGNLLIHPRMRRSICDAKIGCRVDCTGDNPDDASDGQPSIAEDDAPDPRRMCREDAYPVLTLFAEISNQT